MKKFKKENILKITDKFKINLDYLIQKAEIKRTKGAQMIIM